MTGYKIVNARGDVMSGIVADAIVIIGSVVVGKYASKAAVAMAEFVDTKWKEYKEKIAEKESK